uniref:Uncharacterized protein n=1 Tax=Neobodo designis TaxID=312471 RepID=A0A7S1LZT8_NEODS|mmetsp:Transcript_31584/g.97575  ORF Transcript_31584/g.97575 Transcript_31584/m.97575 type:complete len:538 (+) Transcript_31584:474-2087(+)|eukprot:CAMPEP_0174853714 /NCGR_PEP_ID=MMETSP1114-20130205/29534_1 /TAXON_ID=312471 /ORGANISM="Neobodo designis, Strain CCAP 1951/1" /LENGTH=537 /DNA_ID=CAMNT_0016088379 /DNA_START=474 /DNA_END=2087 /DNA_ORIENTATION=-
MMSPSDESSSVVTTREEAAKRAIPVSLRTGDPAALVDATAQLFATKDRAAAVGGTLLRLFAAPAGINHVACKAFNASPVAHALDWRRGGPTWSDEWNPHRHFGAEPRVPSLALAPEKRTRRQRRRLEGASFTFDTAVSVAAAAGDLHATLTHVLRTDAVDLRPLLGVIFGDAHASEAADEARERGVSGPGGEDVLRVLRCAPELVVATLPTVDPAGLAHPATGAPAPRVRHDDEHSFRATVAQAVIAAAIADQLAVLLAVAAVVPLSVLCDVLLMVPPSTRAPDGASTLFGDYLPSEVYRASDLRAHDSAWTPMHFVAAAGSATFCGACFAIIALADTRAPHFVAKESGVAARHMRQPPFNNCGSTRAVSRALGGPRGHPNLALHRVCTVGNGGRGVTPLHVASSAGNEPFLVGLAHLGHAFRRRPDVHHDYASALFGGLLEEVIVEAAASDMADAFAAVTTEPFPAPLPSTLNRAASLALTEQRVCGTLVTVTKAGGVPDASSVSVTSVGVLAQAARAGAALPRDAQRRVAQHHGC